MDSIVLTWFNHGNAARLSGEIANNATADVTVDEYHRYKVTKL
jgi:hypothetical protein